MIKNMDLEFSHGQIKEIIKVNGRMEYNMEMGYLPLQMVNKRVVNG